MVNESRDAYEPMDLIRQEAMAFAGIGLYRFDFDGIVLSMDRQSFLIYELEGHFPDHRAVVGRNFTEIVRYVGAEGTLRKEIREKGRVRGREWCFHTLTGKPKWIMEDAYLVLDPETGGESIQVLARDITPEKRAEAARVENERKYRDILDNIQEGYYEVEPKGSFTFANKALCRIFGYSEEEILGLDYRAYYAGATAAALVYKTYNEVYRTGQPVQIFDWQAVRKDGKTIYLEVSISLIRDADGRKTGFRGIARDVTEHRRALLALRASEELYRELFENANDVVYTHDLEGHFTSLNKAGESVSGYTREELMGRPILEVLPPDEREMAQQQILRKLAGEPPTRYEIHVIAKDGHLASLEVSSRIIKKDGQPVAVQGIARDISERKQAEADRARLEAQIRHSQKLESLGVLAGGIAHDFNNLLVGILGYVGLAMGKVPAESPLRTYLGRIETSAQRAAELTSQMLAYSGKGTFVVRPLNLSKLVEEVGHLLQASVSKMAVIEYRCPPDLPPVVADPTQMHQVVMNLMTNASDAIGSQPGLITLVTGVVDIDRAYLTEIYTADDLPEGRYVYLEVTDTGCGMDAETQARIFDPFFSTKFQGRGLGLAAVLGIVRSHRGTIKVYSELERGTTFKLLFPAAACSQPEAPSAEEDMRRERLLAWRRGGTIIVADDEEYARAVAKEALEGHGFTVHTAHNGREAVELLRQHANEVVAILLDLTMPIMSGDEAFDLLRAIRPDVPIILTSGYSEGDTVKRFQGRGPSAFIQKPYVLLELTAKFYHVLERPELSVKKDEG